MVGALTLLVGFAVAQATGNRGLGGVVLVVGAAWCVWAWRRSPMRALVALVAFGAAFVISHPLGTVIGAWPSVLLASLVAGVVAWLVAPAHREPTPIA